MILIKRGNPSDELSAPLAAQNSSAAWINIDPSDTKAIRKAFGSASKIKELTKKELFTAQHGLCAYCMAKISLTPTKEEEKNKKIKIEHYIPLSKDKNHVFDFNNYFLACTGGAHDDYKNSKENLCCDSKKEENSLTIDPTDPDHIRHLYYQDNGMIMFYDPANGHLTKTITDDLNITLGLNGTFYMTRNNNNNKHDTRTLLVERRKDAFKQVSDYIEDLKNKHELTKEKLESLIAQEESKPKEFSGVILSVYRATLKQCLQQASGTN